MKSLRIRTWLLLALVMVIVSPVLADAVVYHLLPMLLIRTPGTAVVWAVMRTAPSRWRMEDWQRETDARLEQAGIAVRLVDHQGNTVFASRSAYAESAGTAAWVQPVILQGGAGTAYFSGRGTPPPMPPAILRAVLSSEVRWVTGMGALLLTLAGAIWLLERAVLRPLSAMSLAARRIAAGELTFAIPASRVSEVAQVTEAFQLMGDALRESLQREADLEQERRMFISAIAHDLRTPLFSLRGYLEALESGVATTPEKTAQYVRVCREKADSLDRLISGLFAYVRTQYLDQAVNRHPHDIGELLRRTIEGLVPQASAKGVQLKVMGPDTPYVIEIDEYLVMRAVENLVDNAIRYTQPGGVVEVTWQPTQTQVSFTVADTGPGIAAEDLPHIFRPTYRGDPSRNPRTGGMGLGLTIAQRIIRAHGGDVTARNRPGGGAEFVASLPACSGMSSGTEPAP